MPPAEWLAGGALAFVAALATVALVRLTPGGVLVRTIEFLGATLAVTLVASLLGLPAKPVFGLWLLIVCVWLIVLEWPKL